MAQLELILQAVRDTTHAAAIRTLLEHVSADQVLISVAFVHEAGVEAIEEALKPVAAKTEFFVGIRNGITTVQGIKRLLASNAKIYAVDTGSRDTIFHPKLYLATGGQKASLIVGSANLTFQGLHNNIEVSALVALDLTDGADRNFVEQTLKAFKELNQEHPEHVFAITNEKQADDLLLSGRLADETVIPAPSTVIVVKKSDRDPLPRMKLKRVARRRIKAPVRRTIAAKAGPRKNGGAAVTAATTAPTPALPIGGYYLVWESDELVERDLSVPSGATTHATGSMLWKKGAMENIDQRHFFREEVFSGLTWKREPNKKHLERTEATFELVIKNLNYGKFKLRLTHNTDTTSKTYLQNNAMTQIHWGSAKTVVARRDLLGRTMYLYRKDTNPPEFLIEID
jgi:HKD family nuclease